MCETLEVQEFWIQEIKILELPIYIVFLHTSPIEPMLKNVIYQTI